MPRFHLDRPWRTLWGIATSGYLLATVLLVLALSLLVAAWFPQTSREGLTNDVEWQAEVQRRFGEAGWFNTLRSALEAVGAFHVADALGFRVILALLTFCLLVRIVDTLDRVRPSRLQWGDRHAQVDDTAPDGTADAAHEPGNVIPGRARLVRWPWKEIGALAAYLGVLLILLGVAITHQNGWREGPLSVTVGNSIPLGNTSGLTLRLIDLDPVGRRGVAEIWRSEETLISSGDLTEGEPLVGASVGAFLVGSGTGWSVQATRGDQGLELATGPGRAAQTELDLIFSETDARQLVGVPEADLVLLLAMPDSQSAEASIQAQVFEEGSGTYIDEREITAETTFTVRDVTWSLKPIPFAEIEVIHDRGLFWSQLGALGAILGLSFVGLGFIWTRWKLPRGL
jgi:hypothetical protein